MKGWQMIGVLGGVAIAYGCQIPIALSPQSSSLMANTHEAVRVTRVVSGQTIEVQPLDSTTALNQTIRLNGIQAPNSKQTPWGPAAQNHLETLLLGQTVYLSPKESTVDAYNRRWADVWFQGDLINQTLVAEGLALVNENSAQSNASVPSSANPSPSNRLLHAQHRARTLGIGLWNPENPMRLTPNEFRKQQF